MIPLFLFDVALAAITSAVGVTLGFWLRGRSSGQRGGNERQQALDSLAHLHQLAKNVAADVGAHSDRVQEINDGLHGGEQSADSVIEAMSQLIEANGRMQKQLESAEDQIQQQARQMQSFEAQALTDGLTGIANRRAFDDFIRRQQAEFTRHGRPVTVMIMDVDRFKKFNDTYGHQAGDAVLRGVARVLTKTMRDVDLVARYGGEEFVVVFPGERVQQCIAAAERARAAIETAVFEHQAIQLQVTASFGLAELRGSESIEDVVKRADEALYAAKNAGRNKAHWHDGETSYPVAKEVGRISNPSEPAGNSDLPAAEPDSSATDCQSVLQEEAIEESLIDEFTGLSTRRAFADDVTRRVAERNRSGSPLSLVLVGVDDLDGLVAGHGRQCVPVVLKAATQFLKAAMRDMDYVARYGEDAFALLLPGANLTAAESIAQRLRQAIAKCALPLDGKHVKRKGGRESFSPSTGDAASTNVGGEKDSRPRMAALPADGSQLRFTVCLGVVEAQRGGDKDELMSRAEQTLAAARKSGANRAFVLKDGQAVLSQHHPVAVEA